MYDSVHIHVMTVQGGKTTLTGKQLKAKRHSKNVGIPVVTDNPEITVVNLQDDANCSS